MHYYDSLDTCKKRRTRVLARNTRNTFSNIPTFYTCTILASPRKYSYDGVQFVSKNSHTLKTTPASTVFLHSALEQRA